MANDTNVGTAKQMFKTRYETEYEVPSLPVPLPIPQNNQQTNFGNSLNWSAYNLDLGNRFSIYIFGENFNDQTNPYKTLQSFQQFGAGIAYHTESGTKQPVLEVGAEQFLRPSVPGNSDAYFNVETVPYVIFKFPIALLICGATQRDC